MFLSISIPVYNAEKYIDRCINSVMQQTFSDYELILVDDGSKDNSLEKCHKWESKYPDKIRVISKKNTGSLLTRRRCIKESKGDYLYIIDADDYLVDNGALQKVVDIIKKYQCDLCFFNVTTKLDGTLYYKYPFKDEEKFEGKSLRKIYDVLLKGDSLNSLWNKVFSKELVDTNEEDYEKYSYLSNGTDMFQAIPIIMKAKRIIYLDRAFYYYQINNNDESIVHKFNPLVFESLKINYMRLKKYLEEKNVINEKMDRVLNVRYIKIASTAAYKARLIKNDDYDVLKYLQSIGEDSDFREKYLITRTEKIEVSRKAIAFLLFHRFYRLLSILIKHNK